ncbi:CDC9 ATP-dependent DNA ligase [uncultured Caudovirales phage]|uniref:DNA ligase n=1 Tax=uncultured Caudovirales phage TaxID=2100421 RepID=A0A6J5KNW8_9CAUD|nr:CDC9 ATP-dependent DNA ligase [uncultured Caudovirales phage]CAB4123978.1 CDC9 ATP-dependent DNA ligase [uncultured Caudovirales phage]CAB5219555.1 CDC9 ATP-dependent DNA ligase [uncultured Caudovirales phage]
MTSSDLIFEKIEEIGAVSGKNDKEALIALMSGDDEFEKVLRYAYDPFTRFGIAKVPERSTFGAGTFTEGGYTWAILDKLAERELTGNAAREAVENEINRLGEDSSQLFKRILTKDLRAGFSESTINKAIPGLIPTFDCMLAHKYEASRIKSWPQVVEAKLDGVRVLAFVDIMKDSVFFYSRSGKEFNTFDHLKRPILDMVEMARPELTKDNDDDDYLEIVLDGEIVSGSFNKTVSEVRKKDVQASDAEFHIFDVLPLYTFEQEDKTGCKVAGKYSVRRKRLELIVSNSPTDMIKTTAKYLVNSQAEIAVIYDKVRARGLEGLIVKDLDGLYHRRRNHGWMKIKNEESVDVPIIAVEEGTGKYIGQLGALVVDVEGIKVNVGSGLSDEQRASFWEAKDELIGRLVEVEFHEKTPDGSLRHPRFIRFRDDK